MSEQQLKIVAPWDSRAAELEESQGVYAHYAAWCEWLNEWDSHNGFVIDFDLTECEKVALYSAFCAAIVGCELKEGE